MKLIMKQDPSIYDEGFFDPRYLRQDSAPDKVMFNMQGPLHLENPLEVTDGTQAAEEEIRPHRKQSMQNDTQGGC